MKNIEKIAVNGHYTEHTVEELDDLPLDSEERIMEQALVLRWFREKYGDFLRYDWGEVPHFLMIQIEMTKGKTYEEAELACIKKLIEIAKQNG